VIFANATAEDLEGRVLATRGTFGIRVVRYIGRLPGSPFVWVWGSSTDELNDDLHRWEAYYPEEEVPFIGKREEG